MIGSKMLFGSPLTSNLLRAGLMVVGRVLVQGWLVSSQDTCTDTEDCGTGLVCQQATCVDERGARCVQDEDCPTLNCFTHSEQIRYGRCGQCGDDSHCTHGQFSHCTHKEGILALGMCSSCTSDADCSSKEYCHLSVIPEGGMLRALKEGRGGRGGHDGGWFGGRGTHPLSIVDKPSFQCEARRAKDDPCTSSMQCASGLSCKSLVRHKVCSA